jgi:hypothetical protein
MEDNPEDGRLHSEMETILGSLCAKDVDDDKIRGSG